jgi:hypothetical protein
VGTTGTEEPDPIPVAGFELEFQTTAPCWVALTLDGERAVRRIMLPGEVERHRVSGTAVLRVGDTGAFTYTINGRPGRPLGPRGGVSTVRIGRDTVSHLLR